MHVPSTDLELLIHNESCSAPPAHGSERLLERPGGFCSPKFWDLSHVVSVMFVVVCLCKEKVRT